MRSQSTPHKKKPVSSSALLFVDLNNDVNYLHNEYDGLSMRTKVVCSLLIILPILRNYIVFLNEHDKIILLIDLKH